MWLRGFSDAELSPGNGSVQAHGGAKEYHHGRYENLHARWVAEDGLSISCFQINIYPVKMPGSQVVPPFAPAQIGAKVRELRRSRSMTQSQLASLLGVAQGRLSDLERGKASFTAEQLLTMLRIFNVPASVFAPGPTPLQPELQNAVSRLGARHIVEADDVIPSERLRDVYSVVREVLADPQSPRLVTGLAPVIVANIDSLNIAKLVIELRELGLERRLFWLLDNVHRAVRRELTERPSARRARQLRRADLALGSALKMPLARPPKSAQLDLLDPTVRSSESVRELEEEASAASKRWNVATALQTQDFYDALKQAGHGPL